MEYQRYQMWTCSWHNHLAHFNDIFTVILPHQLCKSSLFCVKYFVYGFNDYINIFVLFVRSFFLRSCLADTWTSTFYSTIFIFICVCITMLVLCRRTGWSSISDLSGRSVWFWLTIKQWSMVTYLSTTNIKLKVFFHLDLVNATNIHYYWFCKTVTF